MSLLRSIATVGGFTLISRITGFARDILIARYLGAGPVADAFFVAFKFPNLFRRLFAEGAFSAAFVPLFAGKLEKEGKEAAQKFAEESLAALLWGLLVFVALMQMLMPWAMLVFAPGFLATPGKFDLAVALARLTFPYLLLISLVSLFGGILNSLHKFAAAAATPILLNLTLMAALVGLSPVTATPGHALAWGTSIAGALQLLWMIFAVIRAGYRLRLFGPRLTEPVKLLLKRILPGALGAGIYQVNLLIDTIIASLVGTGAISFLYYADRVNQLPLGVVGTAVGTALLPLLARQLRAGEIEAARASQNRALEFALLLTLPAMAGIAALSHPIVEVLFERGAFGPEETAKTAAALAAFSLGLPAYVLNKCLTPSFFAREDTATPVKVAAVALLANVILNLILILPFSRWNMAHVGIALATALSAWINVAILAALLKKRDFYSPDERLRSRAPRILAVSLAMGLLLGLSQFFLPKGGDFAGKALTLGLEIGGGMLVFALLAFLSKAADPGEIRRYLKRARPS